jgi:hypothetical protein
MDATQLDPARAEPVLDDATLDAERRRFHAARDPRADERNQAGSPQRESQGICHRRQRGNGQYRDDGDPGRATEGNKPNRCSVTALHTYRHRVARGKVTGSARCVATQAMSSASQLTKNRQPTHPGVVLYRRRRSDVTGAPVTTQTAGSRPSAK